MIYCVEDESSIRDLLSYVLEIEGFSCRCFPSAGPFWDALKKETPQLIMLDIMLPGESGLDILKKLKENPYLAEIPVIMATAKGTEADRVFGLDLGADDYLVKPYSMKELVSRIRAVLRRTTKPRDTRKDLLSCGHIRLDKAGRQTFVGGAAVNLTLKEYDLLCLLLENQGTAFSREEIVRRVWGSDFVGESRTVDVHVGTLRTKLRDAGDLLQTVRGVGYKLEEHR